MKKLLVLLLTAACALCLAFAVAGCKPDDEHVHDYGELIPEKSATCTEEGLKAHYYCSGCQKYFDSEKSETTLDELKIDIDPTAHTYGTLIEKVEPTCTTEGTEAHYHCDLCDKYFDLDKQETTREELKVDINPDGHSFVGGKCEYCEKVLYAKNADGTINMGEYPQSEVEESGLKVTLGLEASKGELPTADNAHGWTNYGYYIEGEVQNFMWYIDVEYEDNRYRGVYFTSYRPESATDSSMYSCYQNDNGYEINTAYWFKFEPIKWRLLSQSDGTALLMSNIILDSQQYYHEKSGTRQIADNTVYTSNYKESDLRKWLNDTFYKTSFDDLAKSIIQETEVDNSANTAFMNDVKFASENTHDKIFLLSPADIINSEYGFAEDVSTSDSARQLESTAYAKSQGVNVTKDGYSWWWLRSPMNEKMVHYIHNDGTGKTRSVVNTFVGVVPALRIKL